MSRPTHHQSRREEATDYLLSKHDFVITSPYPNSLIKELEIAQPGDKIDIHKETKFYTLWNWDENFIEVFLKDKSLEDEIGYLWVPIEFFYIEVQMSSCKNFKLFQ